MMKRNIKMIGFDLDGTLLNSNKEISDYTRDVMREAVEQGVIILPATGRPLTGIPKPVMALPGIRYAVTANGARVVDVQEDKVLHEALLPYEKGKELLEIFAKYDTYREVYYEGFGYATADMVERIEEYMPIKPMIEYMRTTRRRMPDVEAMFHEKKMAVDKLQALFRDTETRDLAMKEVKEKVQGAAVTSALGNNIEANGEDAQKGIALLKLGEILGIKKDEIMAFGDGSNDMDMIRRVGFGVAMENGIDEIKEAADYITVTNDEHGVAKAIEKFVLR